MSTERVIGTVDATDQEDDVEPLYRATWRNGAGMKTVLLDSYTVGDTAIVARSVEGERHVWSAGSEVHIQESDVPREEVEA